METRVCQILLDGNPVTDLYEDLIAVEVCEEEGEGSRFAIQLALYLRPNGTWTRLDEEERTSFSLWQRVRILVGFQGSEEVLIDGYITGISPHFGPEETDSFLLIWGQDVSVALDQEERIVAWPDRTFSQIAEEIFTAYGLEVEVEDSQVVHEAEDRLLLQRETDWAFLKRLAARLSYFVHITGAKAIFKTRDLTAPPQPDIAGFYGETVTNLIWFQAEVLGTRTTLFQTARINQGENRVEPVEVETSPYRAIAESDGPNLKEGREAAGVAKRILRPRPTTQAQELEALTTGERGLSDWLVEGEGALDGRIYGRALRAKALVLMKGLGVTWSGKWFVGKVIHRITPESYLQRFWVYRNALGVTGSESYASREEMKARQADVQAPSDGSVLTRTTGRKVSP